MKKSVSVKRTIVFMVVEAVLALIVNLITTYYSVAKETTVTPEFMEKLSQYFDEVDSNESMTYDEVLELLLNDLSEKDQTIASLEAENQELSSYNAQAKLEETNLETVNSAQSFADTNDYKMAISVLNSVSDKTPQMEAMLDTYIQEYESQITSEVDSLLNNGQYDEAESLINEALGIVPNSTSLKEKQESVSAAKPQVLMNVLKPYESSGCVEKTSAEYMEMNGTRYYNGFVLGDWRDDSYAIFNLNGKYVQISGIIGHVDESSTDDAVVTIIADGTIKETIDISFENPAKEFTIDVTGVNILKIVRVKGNAKTGFAELVIKG